jgi:hypothetical protein
MTYIVEGEMFLYREIVNPLGADDPFYAPLSP